MTTITTNMLRFIARTLGTTPDDLLVLVSSNYGVTIDDTPIDDTEKDTEERVMDDLEQRVATEAERAAREHWLTKPGNISTYEAVARAIIPMVLEHAAKVADEFRAINAANLRRADSKWKGFDDATVCIAAAIRAIGAP